MKRVMSIGGAAALLRPSADPEDARLIARVIVSLRLAIVVSAIVAVSTGIDPMGRHPQIAIGVLGVAVIYAVLLMLNPDWEWRNSRSGQAITLVDVTLTLATIATTGGADSPASTILFLAVIAIATRLPLTATVLVSLVVGLSYFVIALVVDPQEIPLDERLQVGLWWAFYILFTAVLAATLTLYGERAHRKQAEAWAEAIAEHQAAEEERDLRARLLSAHVAQRDGLRAILHDFRTPVTSLSALTAALADSGSNLDAAGRESAIRLVGAHIQHLSAMLDALRDVAISRNPTHPAGHPRRVELRDLLLASGDAAGLRPPRLRVQAPDTHVNVDDQRLRRVLTNLLHNAELHGHSNDVEVVAELQQRNLTVTILDRGPGMSAQELAIATRKDVSLDKAGGGSGLGLWIVEQILDAMHGELSLKARDGGGLAAEVRVPIS